MKKLFASLALVGLAGGMSTGIASAHTSTPADAALVNPAGQVHAGPGGGGFLVVQGNNTTINGYIGVEGDGSGVVAKCGSYTHSGGATVTLDPGGDFSCIEHAGPL